MEADEPIRVGLVDSGTLHCVELPESFAPPTDEDLDRVREAVEAQLHGGKVIVLPPGARLTRLRTTPYYVRERVGEVEREVGFEAKWELDEYLAKLDAYLPLSPFSSPRP